MKDTILFTYGEYGHVKHSSNRQLFFSVYWLLLPYRDLSILI
jgi:hypothetical protein